MKLKIVLITLCVLLIAGAVCFVLLKRLPQKGPETVITQDSFKSDADRRAFLKNFLPFEVPESAIGLKYELVEWLDRTLNGSYVLPPAEFEEFKKEKNLKDENKFKHKGGEGSFWLDEATRTIRFHASNMQGK